MVTVIYLDILLSLNLFVDFLLLAATARLLHTPTSRWRLIGGALLGALSSLMIFLPPLGIALSILCKALAAALMVLIAFPYRGFGAYLRETTVLFLISALFAGVCAVGQWMLSPVGLAVQSGVVYYEADPLWLILFTVIAYGALTLFDRLTRKRVALGQNYRVELEHSGHRVTLRAMLDSGHSLCDSFSGAPVVLAGEQALGALNAACDLSAGHVRYIPFSSIGGDGVLLAFRPDRAVLYADARPVDVSGVWVAAVKSLGRGEYDALIGPALADRL
ncbi:MAG: sigma-E processing peptidase SpoIIGA [Clostridia bacterium]|nr:sigma-E processing peptidase SpoIIGA [Clostridia bacterium]